MKWVGTTGVGQKRRDMRVGKWGVNKKWKNAKMKTNTLDAKFKKSKKNKH